MPLTRIETNALQSAITSGNIADGTIVAGDLASNSVTAPKIAAGAVENYMATNGSNFMFRNRVINGAMSIAQRATIAPSPLTGTGNVYTTLDRFKFYRYNNSGTFTYGALTSQVTDHPTNPSNGKCLEVSCTATGTTSTNVDFFTIEHDIESSNIYDLDGKPLTLSFWAKTNKTGLYSVQLRYSRPAATPVIVKTFNVTNTGWNKYVITFPAQTIASTPADNNAGLYIMFQLASGMTSAYAAEIANAYDNWYAYSSNGLAAVGQTNLFTNVGNYFRLTEVQLEGGSVATPFEYRPYDVELAMCQRYLHVWSSFGQSYRWVGGGFSGTNNAQIHYRYPVIMRAAPSVSFSEQNKWIIDAASGAYTSTAIEGNWQTNEQTRILLTVASGVTANWPIMIANNGDAGTRWIRFDAEL